MSVGHPSSYVCGNSTWHIKLCKGHRVASICIDCDPCSSSTALFPFFIPLHDDDCTRNKHGSAFHGLQVVFDEVDTHVTATPLIKDITLVYENATAFSVGVTLLPGSVPAYIYCLSVPGNAHPISVSQVINNGHTNLTSQFFPGKAVLTFSNALPSTLYKVSCIATSMSGVVGPYNTLKTISVQTSGNLTVNVYSYYYCCCNCY